MEKKEFLENLQELLQRDEAIDQNACLSDLEEWDSLSMMSVVVFFSKVSGKKIDLTTVRNAQSVNELYDLIKG